MLNVKALMNGLELGKYTTDILECEPNKKEHILCTTLYILAENHCTDVSDIKGLKNWASENMDTIFEYYDVATESNETLEDVIFAIQYYKNVDEIWGNTYKIILGYILNYIYDYLKTFTISEDIFNSIKKQALTIEQNLHISFGEIYNRINDLFDGNWIGIDVKQETLDCGEFGKYFLNYTEGSIDDIMNEIADNNVDIYNDDLKLYLNNNFDKVNEYLQNYKIEFSDDYSLFDGIQAVQYSHIMENLDKHFKDSMLYLVLDYYSCTHDTQLIDENLLTNFENSIVEIINNNDVQSTNIKQYYNIVNNVL